MDSVRQISGPVSQYKLKLDATDVYLFGDAHFSYKNQCESCEYPKCAEIATLIEETAVACVENGVPMDVLFEFPYVPRKSHSEYSTYMKSWDDFFLRAKKDVPGNNTGRYWKKFFASLHEFNNKVIGIFSELYRRFRSRVYDHKDANVNGVRFHYGDIRRESNIETIFDPKKFAFLQEGLPTISRLRELMETFVYSKDFISDMQRLLPKGGFKVDASMLSHDMHKIAKQFYKLPEPERGAMKAYVDRRLDAMMHDVRIHSDFDAFAKRVSRLMKETAENEQYHYNDLAILSVADQVMLKAQAESLIIMYHLVMQTFLMDVYLLSRMMYCVRTFHDKPGIVIVYAGDAHIKSYVDFLVHYMDAVPVECVDNLTGDVPIDQIPVRLLADLKPSAINRCVKPTSPCSRNITEKQNVRLFNSTSSGRSRKSKRTSSKTVNNVMRDLFGRNDIFG